MAIGQFAGNFLAAFNQAKMAKQNKEDEKKERDAKMKLFELQMKREQAAATAAEQQQAARKQVFDLLGGVSEQPTVPGTAGINPMAGAKPSLSELLSDPKNALLLLQSGMGNLGDITAMQGQAGNQKLLESAIGGAGQGQMGGMELSGIKLDASGRPMLDLSRREVARWMPSPEGREMIGVDKMGREMVRRPGGPGDRADEDVPMTPDRLAEFRTPDGKMLAPGTTLRQAQQMGAVTAPKPTEGDKQKSMLLEGMSSAEQTLGTLKGTDTSSKTNRALGSTPVTELFTTSDYRKYEAATQQWIQNYVFLKSGAQAGPVETQQTFEMFFPQPGDDEEVKAQKALARKTEMENMRKKYGNQGAAGGGKVIDFSELPD